MMLKLRRDAAGLPIVDHGRVDLWSEDGSVNARYNDLPDDVSQAEIEELRQMGYEARTRSGRPGLPTPPPTPIEQTLREAQMRAELARLERDTAIAEAEAVQARIASGHLQRQVTRKNQGVRGLQLFWMGLLGYVVGTVAGSFLGAGVGFSMLIGIAGAWLLVWGRLHRVAVETRREEARLERLAWLERRRAREDEDESEPPTSQ